MESFFSIFLSQMFHILMGVQTCPFPHRAIRGCQESLDQNTGIHFLLFLGNF